MGTSATQVKEGLWAFQYEDQHGPGTSWWLGCTPEPLLIDCPPLNEENLSLLKKISAGKEARIILTSRKSHGNIQLVQEAFSWPVLIQEQESYLLPSLKKLETFSEAQKTVSSVSTLWTPGPTPGSCIAYAPEPWNVLFCGRLLIPVAFNKITSFSDRTTFHRTRQKKSLQKLRNWIPLDARPSLASGGSLKALCGGHLVEWEGWIET